jgi:hypothetical protein
MSLALHRLVLSKGQTPIHSGSIQGGNVRPKATPAAVKADILHFFIVWMTVSYKSLEQQVLRDARTIEKTTATPTFEVALDTVLGRPRANIRLPGLPESNQLVMFSFPVVFMYAAFMLRSAVRKWLRSDYSDEPWLLLNASETLEVLAAIGVCTALMLSGLMILQMIVLTDLQLDVRLMQFLSSWKDDAYY